MSNVHQVSVVAPPRGVVARLTPDGGGALGVVRAAGAGADRLVAMFFSGGSGSPREMAVGAVVFGRWQHRTGGAGEPVVLVRIAAECFEIHTHGGRAVASSIVSGLCAAGGRDVSGKEWQEAEGRRGEDSLAHRLATAGGWRAAQILSRQLAGRFAAELAAVEDAVERALAGNAADAAEADRLLARLEQTARIGLRLPDPWRVVVCGEVNVGKSSLVNALAGYGRSLVSPLAGTTRDLLETRLVLDGWEIDLIDTAGLRGSETEQLASVERSGIDRGRAAVATADLMLQLVPAAELERRRVPVMQPPIPRLLVGTKADLLTQPADAAVPQAADVVITSALTGVGIDQLAAAIVSRLVPEAAAGGLAGGVPVTAVQREQVGQLRRRLAGLPVTPDSTARGSAV